MKIPKEKSNTQRTVVAIAVLLLMGTGAAAYYRYSDTSNNSDDQTEERDNTTETSSESESDNDTHQEYNQENPAGVNQPPIDPSQQQANATINIPSYQAMNGTITVNVAISETWESDAVCTMQLEGPHNETITGEVFPQAQISGCQLQATGLPVGNYRVTIFAEHESQRTNTETLDVTL